MLQIERSGDTTIVEAASYRLEIASGERHYVRLEVPPGRPLADLALLSSAHPPGGVDELVELGEMTIARADDGRVTVRQSARSTVWAAKRAELSCLPKGLMYRAIFRGSAALDEVQLFEHGERDDRYLNRPTPSGFWRPPRAREGWTPSRPYFPGVFSPAPNGAARTRFWFGERATNHPANDGSFWGGDWFFTPAPFAYALGGDGRWLLVGLAPRREDLGFVHFDYRGGQGWGLGLTYQGMTRVDGDWEAPRVLMLAGTDEYAALADYHAWLEEDGVTPVSSRAGQSWWPEPIWCGWGEQVAREGRRRANALSTQRNYESWLGLLERHGLSPGTIVIDDRWQARLGGAEPSGGWPRMRQFIADQHARGRRVLLWHNVWEVEEPQADETLILRHGAPALGAFGYPMRDPTASHFGDRMRQLMARLLGPPPEGLGADGLKLDITHSTPSGPGYEGPPAWGNALLHSMLRQTYEAAKETRPDALIESHAANPYFRDTCDALRLNDVFTDLASVVEQMRHRALVARAAGFDLIDTDCWSMPSRAALLEYVETQPELGIPALYYVTRVDQSRERLREADYRRIAAVWHRYRRSL